MVKFVFLIMDCGYLMVYLGFGIVNHGLLIVVNPWLINGWDEMA